MNEQNIAIAEYDYPLPNERIAKFPLAKRDESKLLIFKDNNISESIFKEVPSIIPDGSTVIFNNTKVIYARLVFHKETGARIEIFCLEPIAPADYAESFAHTSCVEWKCMVGNLRKWKGGKLERTITLQNETVTFAAELIESNGLDNKVRFTWDNAKFSFSQLLESIGELPIPPYLNRNTCEQDKVTYQTVYSKIKGSVAAPTAGLHFTPEVLSALNQKNICCKEITLHVGAGTFHPVKSDFISEHEMHTELIIVEKALIEHLRQNIGNVVAVGTTSVRTLESLYYIGRKLATNPNAEMHELHVEQWEPYDGNYAVSTEMALDNIINYLTRTQQNSLHVGTQIIIVPSFKFRIVRGIITNFHQPKSTLLLLVSAFVGEAWKNIYQYALSHDFRFLSYGDSSILLK